MTPQERFAMNIVYQIGDELEISVEKRQATNDKLIDFVIKLLSQIEQEAKQEGRDGLLKELGLTQGWNMKDIKSIRSEERSHTLAEIREKIEEYFGHIENNGSGSPMQINKSEIAKDLLASLEEKKDGR